MPNTLAHIGVQTLATRGILRNAEVKWIWAGCLIPDLPWIGQRLVGAAGIVDPLDLRVYAMAQASLAGSLLLAGALATLARRPLRVFAILSLGCLTHLLLDAAQIKWANGVNLLAPFSWKIWNAGFFWPEDSLTLMLTALGAGTAFWAFLTQRDGAADILRPRRLRAATLALLAAGWLGAPLAAMDAAERAGGHHVDILRDAAARAGREIGFDRARLIRGQEGAQIAIWTGERLAADGALPPMEGESMTVSLKGRFTAPDRVEVAAWHVHPSGVRDYASYAGLALVMGFWALALFRRSPARFLRAGDDRG